METCLEDLRPHAICTDKSVKACSDPATLREGALERYGELRVMTGGQKIPQWHSKYLSQIMPFVIPRMVSGPDFFPNDRWRRTFEDAPLVSVQEFTAGFSRRVEAQCRTDWAALPIIRSVGYKFAAEHTMSLVAPFFGKKNSATNTSAAEYVKAAQNLYHHLHNGFTGKGVHRVPIAGDTTRLPYAEGLSPVEKRLARAQNFLAQNFAGGQQLRRLMGHSQFGARVVYGDCIFFTLSPNEQHDAFVLRLSRFRRNDPYVKHSEAIWTSLASKDYPSVEGKHKDTTRGSNKRGSSPKRRGQHSREEVVIELPEYDLRRAATARDPLAVVEGYKVNILLRLATILGVRMCPDCPRCNEGAFGCQDKFGNNMRPGGGVLGGMPAIGSGTEHQGHGTPHLHAQGHVASAYQFDTMQEIVEKLKAGLFSYSDLVSYQEWLHTEDIVDNAVREEAQPKLEEEWPEGLRVDYSE